MPPRKQFVEEEKQRDKLRREQHKRLVEEVGHDVKARTRKVRDISDEEWEQAVVESQDWEPPDNAA